ncbi:3-oxoadipate enol-lactonase/4-carboxymuconolactone decarboxylase [Nonomuraea muscovyensis]|uniref:3-oxoadipate enol-lactonase/4-carboxymuconolactone decarboxylase n=1 Tax=Nonomuraea muscovyensis TaxID=1124761 RepID=A0A7X0F1E0_9ACTN|nr:4-carboxymuconolactone decarboxylase [Nonomuraea muscovyensis]MBB6348800.1 3-oxoadipate enol-lactonase/4-carboxymuconolactone decarboxylase [Nonomuraea muscovyensis]
MTTPLTLHHRVDGPADGPLLVLGPSLGTTMDVWLPQLPVLTASWRVLRYDLPGHGGSPAASAGFTIDTLARAVLELVPDEPFVVGGVSLGGAIATAIAGALGATDGDADGGTTSGTDGGTTSGTDGGRASGTGGGTDGGRTSGTGGGTGGTGAARGHRRVRGLVLCCTAARFGDPGPWRERAAAVRAGGVAALAPVLGPRWFTPGFDGGWVLDMPAGVDAESYAACCEALAACDLTRSLPAITVPTLVVAGAEDPATTLEQALVLAGGIPDAQLTVVPHAAHLANVERADAVTLAITGHLRRLEPGDRPESDPRDRDRPDRDRPDRDRPDRDRPARNRPARDREEQDREEQGRENRRREDRSREESWAAGMKTRRQVLGDDHVDRAVATTTGFTHDFQHLITRYAWDEIWNRPGLDRRTRSCVTLTALAARGHLDELAMHVRAALRNGLTPDEIGEVLLQTAIYCGVPAANAAFAVAQRVLADD